MNKQILIFLLTAATISLQSQTNQTFTQIFDSVFHNVPYNNATGILHDRVADFSDIERLGYNSTDTVNFNRFLQTYSELNRSITKPSKKQKFFSTK